MADTAKNAVALAEVKAAASRVTSAMPEGYNMIEETLTIAVEYSPLGVTLYNVKI